MSPQEVWRYIEKGSPEDCWPCTSTSRDGRGHRLAYVDGKYQYVHRVVYQVTYGEIPAGSFVLHRCHNSSCCNPQHLKLGDHSENLKDSYASGQRASIAGSLNGRAKLTETLVKIIRGSEDSDASLARRFNVCESAISRARKYITWKNV